jgi:hypothetical protein
MRLLAAILFLMASCTAGWPQSTGNTPSAIDQDTERLLCDVQFDDWERAKCLWRSGNPRRSCSNKPTSQEQIRCLEGTVDTLIDSIPNLIEKHVDSRLKPRMHELGRRP